MINNTLNIIDKISDIRTLQTLKLELTNEKANTKEILQKFLDEYNENEIKSFDKTTYSVNFGHNRTINDFKRDIQKMNPCSPLENYRKTTIKAKGKWKDLFEIAFGSTREIVINKEKPEEKSKQMIIKEAS